MVIPKNGKKFRILIGPVSFDFYARKSADGMFSIGRADNAAMTEENAIEIIDRLNALGISFNIPVPVDGRMGSWMIDVRPGDFPKGGNS